MYSNRKKVKNSFIIAAIINSRENAFIDTLFDFDLWEKAPQQSIDEIIELDGANESNEAEANWNPEELWVIMFIAHFSCCLILVLHILDL
ncbi:hypothetical protein VP01_1162g9 [Puccinia sorghi]|uniref:Uncharacterized protein n=1 Tax=Puccinia sorghi TaxID=27349 RepID=A0A0L6VSX5_9BASI|nr:hypothetical protein VP01_1162g9 [Puccinia sorghi]